ncbi:CLUMA_CG009618, isoform A [Clunio marinus]|uniref:CLUMA_CG009618, isoform A n=1 Tax=Clunio marinus TaxID=568069 RepID=A0A1J1I7D0_9DIPT|nr:CLUMA_CG009618, isoform A [Clunio marinus]
MTKNVMMIEKEANVGLKARTVLWYLTFFGFAINYIIRINISIAIVDMINPNYKRSSSNRTIITSECIVVSNTSNSPELSNESNLEGNLKYVSIERRLLDFLEIDYDPKGFQWDEHQQSKVLGSFFWLHWVTQVPGGIFAARYGTKFVFGFANFIACLMCFFMPIVCYLDYRWMVAFRLVQGFIAGVAWPAMHHLTGKWIPPNERSKFVTAYLGSSIGVAVAYPIFGFIIKASSWEWVFHSCGIAGSIWFIFWLYYVYDSPENHPRIHAKEKEYILKCLGSSVIQNSKEKRNVPWKAILTSKVVWINTLAQWGGIWGLFTLLTQAPTYFRFIHGWGIEMTGILSGLPHLMRVGFSMAFSSLGDYLLSTNKMSRNNVRRLAAFFSLVLNGFAVLAMAYTGCSVTTAVLFYTMSLSLHGAVSTGALSSIVDIAPNYAGITMGLTSSIAIISGFVSPIVVGYMTFENQSIVAWQHIFQLCAAMLFVTGIIYIWFNDTSIQPWNKIKQDSEPPKELLPLYLELDDCETKKMIKKENELEMNTRS